MLWLLLCHWKSLSRKFVFLTAGLILNVIEFGTILTKISLCKGGSWYFHFDHVQCHSITTTHMAVIISLQRIHGHPKQSTKRIFCIHIHIKCTSRYVSFVNWITKIHYLHTLKTIHSYCILSNFRFLYLYFRIFVYLCVKIFPKL